MTAPAPSTVEIMVVAPWMETSSLFAPNFSIAQKCCAAAESTEVSAFPAGWLMGRPVSKSHQFQCKEQLPRGKKLYAD